MAGGVVRVGAVSVLPCRAAAGRSLRRLLVLGGLLIAGWLLGCAAQSAHADELPPPPVTGAVEKAPLLGRAVHAVREGGPVREAPPIADPVGIVRVAPPEPREEKAARDVAPPRSEAPVEPVAEPVSEPEPERAVTEVAAAPEAHRRPPAPAASHPSRTRPGAGHAARHAAVQDHPAPMPVPEKPGPQSATGGFALTGVTAGFPAAGTRVPVPHRASPRPVSGAVPPAVRTAADEPSFAPD
ncbi:hypothetical protein GWI34_18380 [Actinomadura sp. DSM 109109]|nr:hypothetical protein [Actinomadura lepetitiana]